ncbi:MAG TPA: BPL-N domain-containing protein [Candidatus Sulfotelmatobacter sp.]|nr:BPL-N domain-containing protein [Candidatus Sulfotelmatobacter sp.]
MHLTNRPSASLFRFVLTVASLSAAMFLAACGSSGSKPVPLPPAIPSAEPVLLYVGAGTSSSDVSAIESVLGTLHVGFTTATGSQLEALDEAHLGGYKLIIIPGGNSITIGQNLSANAAANIRTAVTGYGVHYLGVCAGAFFGGYSIYNGVDLTSGVFFNFYAAEFQGIHIEPVQLTFPNRAPLDVYWQDGPQLSGWGNVVARFPDGTPAIVEGNSGPGFVILTGVHLEAPASWRVGLAFNTPLGTDLAYAGTLFQAALNGNPLPHF